jgi:peptidyl-prolyl cis-trans isomerase SurA
MKKLVLVCLCLFFFLLSFSQTLFTYGSHQVSTKEFLNAYNKNNTDKVNNSQSLQDYFDLYVNFKLKVQAAKDMQLDTLPSLIADLQNFRSQIKENYLTDENEMKKLEHEAFQRSQKDIHCVYYLINTANEHDSAKALKEVKELSAQLKDGKNEEKVIAEFNASHLLRAQKQDLGYITVFTLPYQFENIVYALQPGQFSEPYPAKNGWFIFKNEGTRNAVGKITVAQILFAVPEGEKGQKIAAKKLADSVYNALQHGANFESLAKKYSDDRNTFMNGGLMPEFGTAKYDSAFETNAFSLKKDGDISAPFETKFGLHILKRISAAAVPASENDEAYKYNLKQQVLSDNRNNIAREKFIHEIIPVVGLKKHELNKKDLWKVTDSALLKNKNITSGNVNGATVLLSYNNNQKVRVSDWILYLKNLNKSWENNSAKSYQELFPVFVNEFSIANYASRLEKYDPEFKAQVDEFKEGNLLFEIMQRKVWGKATADTTGLKNFYVQHQKKYLWQASAEAIIFSCSNVQVAKNTIAELKKGKDWRNIVKENSSSLQADSGRFDLGQIPVVERTAFSEGLITLPVINKNDGTAMFAKIIKLYPDGQQRNFENARGLVINDYQTYLERKWITQLKKKYPVKVNDKALQSLLHKK